MFEIDRNSIREKLALIYGRNPCLWQADAVAAQLGSEKHVLVTAPTGLGKTLALLGAVILETDSINLFVSPLTLLASQTETTLRDKGVPAKALFAGAMDDRIVKVSDR